MARTKIFRASSRRIRDGWWHLVQTLQEAGLWPRHQNTFNQLEGAVQEALSPVRPPANFRQGLRENLALAAKGKMSGLAIEYPKPFREGIILGISAGFLAAIITTLVIILRSRLARAER